MNIVDMLKDAVEKKASDIFIIAGLPPSFKINGVILNVGEDKLTCVNTQGLVEEIYQLAERGITALSEKGDDDFSFAIPGISRFRVSTYKQRGSLAAVIRIIQFTLPDPKQLGIPDEVIELHKKAKGLILITGPAGSGKSTTLACIIDAINRSRCGHVITLEDPLEYLHTHNKSIVSQREVSTDTESYVTALRAALRQSPDVILLGEMRDYETMNVAMTAAETGHLIISTMHTVGAANTIDRIVDSFPPAQQQQIRLQLSMVLQAVVSQQLIPTVDNKLVPAFEVMMANTAIRNLIRESKAHQIEAVIYSSNDEGMLLMDSSIEKLYLEGKISKYNALRYASNSDNLLKRI